MKQRIHIRFTQRFHRGNHKAHLPVANEGNSRTTSEASFRTLLEYLRLSTSSSKSSSKSSMSSTVSSLRCEELRDWDIDKLAGSSACSPSRGSEIERLENTGVGTTTGIHGGVLRGGEPEDSGFVTRKNSSVTPALFLRRNNKR